MANQFWRTPADRLIDQPIYQYGAKDSGDKTGGGDFLFCQGTDPELILLLEARPAGNKLAWHYAVAPFTDYALDVNSVRIAS